MSAPPGLTPQLTAFNEELAAICSDPPPVTKEGSTNLFNSRNFTFEE